MKIRDALGKVMIDVYPDIIKNIGEDGNVFDKYGPAPRDKEVGYYLVSLYFYDHPQNPYYKDKSVVKKGIRVLESMYRDTGEDGLFRNMNKGRDRGRSCDDWRILKWIESIDLLKKEPGLVPQEVLDKWQARLHTCGEKLYEIQTLELESEKSQYDIKNHGFRNRSAWGIAAAYRYGKFADRQDICDWCGKIMKMVCDNQLPEGAWLEHEGYVIGYGSVTLNALNHYYFHSKDEIVAEKMKNLCEFLFKVTYDKGESMGSLDIRTPTCADAGPSPLFASALLGRDEVFRAHATLNVKGILANYSIVADCGTIAAVTRTFEICDRNALMYEGDYKKFKPQGKTVFAGSQTGILREYGFTIPMCCMADKLYIESMHKRQRQSLAEVYHKDKGLIIGGGNSINNPAFSSFHAINRGISTWVHTDGFYHGKNHSMVLWYNEIECRLSLEDVNEKEVTLKYTSPTLLDNNTEHTKRVYVNIPLFTQLLDKYTIGDKIIDLTGTEVNSAGLHAGLPLISEKYEIILSRHAVVKYPEFMFTRISQELNSKVNAYAIITVLLTYDEPEVMVKIKLR